jgi:hypothetical protein
MDQKTLERYKAMMNKVLDEESSVLHPMEDIYNVIGSDNKPIFTGAHNECLDFMNYNDLPLLYFDIEKVKQLEKWKI